jgi:hypothetical protein
MLGLCSDCIHMREISSDRGATFYRCALSDTDPHFPKYPRLPVLHCSGHHPISASGSHTNQKSKIENQK